MRHDAVGSTLPVLMAQRSRQVVFGLGSNLGDRVRCVLVGAGEIARTHGVLRASLSPLYETTPVGGPPQGDYINAALAVDTPLPANVLLDRALGIEAQHGRVRRERFGPRTLDIDILWVDGEVVDEHGLQVPHPRLYDRAFALQPLLDVVPQAVDPRNGKRLSDAVVGLSTSGMRRLHRSSVSFRGVANEFF